MLVPRRLDVNSYLLTVDNVAEMIGVSDVTVRSWVRKGHLPAVRIGGRRQMRFFRAEVLQYLAERSFPAKGG